MYRDILQEKVSQGKFSNWIRGRLGRVSFLLELIKFEEEKRFGLKTNCYYEKREINTLENFPCEFFSCRISLCL